MTKRSQPSALAAAMVERLDGMVLTGAPMQALFDSFCQGLSAGGLPLTRGFVSFRVLHPLYEAASMVWSKQGVENQLHPQGGSKNPEWLRSPLHMIQARQVPMIRRHLTGASALLDFALLEDLKAAGGTDYAGFGVSFNEAWTEGVLSSWMTDRPRGFSDADLRDLQHLMQPLAIALKSRIEKGIAENIATAYLGQRAGRRVLDGAIRRGDGERVSGALWYSDLRGSTALAERLSPEDFLAALNSYFDRAAAAILAGGGEVVSYIGDGVLGFFPDGGDPAGACQRALSAARAAGPGQAAGEAAGESAGQFGAGVFTLALHHGSFIYGNIGTEDRLQFTAIGRAINEVARLQDLTKNLEEPLLASGVFAKLAGGRWRDLGSQKVRGVDQPLTLFAQ